jgi:hypothetical protein
MNSGSIIAGGYSTGYYPSNGLIVSKGTFTMNGGTISGNNTPTNGGISVGSEGTFNMNGGTISGFITEGGLGGGVENLGIFNMSGGNISGNTALVGGGVGVAGGTFTMSGGTIAGNTAVFPGFGGGGGVYIEKNPRMNGSFVKTGGTITGYASDTVNGNIVKDSSGVAMSDHGHTVYVYVESGDAKRRETTAGPGVNLSFNGNTGASSGGAGIIEKK